MEQHGIVGGINYGRSSSGLGRGAALDPGHAQQMLEKQRADIENRVGDTAATQTPVNGALVQQQVALQRLHAIVDLLSERVSGASVPQPPQTGTGGASSPAPTPVASQLRLVIQQNTEAIQTASDRLNYLIERLDI